MADNSHNTHNTHAAAPQKGAEETNRKWWKLPFDTTTNFSLIGFFLGGARIKDNPVKKVDMTLNE